MPAAIATPLDGKSRREQRIEPAWKVAHVAFGVVTLEQSVDQHQGKQQGVPVAGPQHAKAVAREQGPRLAAGEAAHIVHAPVMRRQQPAIGRQIENRDRARPQAAMRLLEGKRRLDSAMAKDIDRQVAAQRAAAQGHFGDRARGHRPSRLGRGEGCRHLVVLQAEGGIAGHRGPELQQHAAGAAAGVEHGPGALRARQGAGQKLCDKRTQAAIPPHAVLDLVHALVFDPFHAVSAPRECLLTARL